MPYPEMFVAPMRADLTSLGVRELRTSAEVDAAVAGTKGTLMIIVNSVCGCAAGRARPGVALAAPPCGQAGCRGVGVRWLRCRRHEPGSCVLRRIHAVLPLDRSPAERPARVPVAAPPDREPERSRHRRCPDRRLRQVLHGSDHRLATRPGRISRAAGANIPRARFRLTCYFYSTYATRITCRPRHAPRTTP